MKQLRSKVVVDGLIFPEGIRWAQGKIWFSDILDFTVYAYDPRTGATAVVVETPLRPSGLGFTPDGRLLIAAWERTLYRLDPDGLTVVAEFGDICSQTNDMVVDGAGRAYIDYYLGNPVSDHAAGQRKGGLLAVEPGGETRIVADGLRAPNGMGVTADGATLLVNDTDTIFAFDVKPNGDLANRRVFAPVGGDGLCLDVEGAAWVGGRTPGGERAFVRVLEGGEVTHAVPAPGCGMHAIAPVLGAPDRRTLYGCVHHWDLDGLLALVGDIDAPRKAANAREVSQGWIYAAEGIEVPGGGWP